MPTNEDPTRAFARMQWRLKFQEKKLERLNQARKRALARQEKNSQTQNIVISVRADTRARADKACMKIEGVSIADHLRTVLHTFAAMPEGIILPHEKPHKRHKFFETREMRTFLEEFEEQIKYIEHEYPHGMTMDDLVNGVIDTQEHLQGLRSTHTLYGRAMKALGYRKVRTYISFKGEPARLGWIYRKETPEGFLA